MSTLLVLLSMVVGCGIALHYLLIMTRAVPCYVKPLTGIWPVTLRLRVPITGFPRQRPSIRLQP